MRLALSIAIVAMLLLVHPPVLASGGSYLVDDASVAGPGQCQVESWLRAWSKGKDGLWTVPACGAGPVELGLSFDREQGLPGMALSPSVKWQLRNGDDRGVGVAIEVNATYQRGRHVATQAYVATTFGLDDARHLMLALNLGVDSLPGIGSQILEGVGLEYALDDRWSVLAERLWSRDSVSDQGGVRLTMGASSFDLVLGRDRSKERSHWINLGWNIDL